jgi:radical SAM superfamily enzyme YgiQ (UPF0313 family)
MGTRGHSQKFIIEIIKPSHYDDQGYVIQWWRAFVPSNSLACMYALVHDAIAQRPLGDDVEFVVNAYDECHTVIPVKQIIRRIKDAGNRGIVFLTGVQSNQFPRATDLAREFRAAGIQVVIGGFHVSGCIAMLPELPPDIQAVQKMGVSLFAGEAEGRLATLIQDAHRNQLQPVYNYLLDLPDLQGQVTPELPLEIARRYMLFTAFDAGRGCPFQCSFCTIINVQGRKSRYRDADDVERVVRQYLAKGIKRFFITDDNMARNKNWEAIFDRLIQLREKEGLDFKCVIQVDTMCHKIPNFIEKATRAGVNRVFIGLENINPDNLAASKKFQNRITEYRRMLQEWRSRYVLTFAGYILGFPNDTPESIARDIRVIQEELPIDVLEFFILTPLPGSADHRALHQEGVWMDPDMNKYDLEHATTGHKTMSRDELQAVYSRSWHQYYSPAHIQTLMRRAEAMGAGSGRLSGAILGYYGSFRFENVHPLQAGIFRRRVRRLRRHGMSLEHPLWFYPRRAAEILSTYGSLLLFAAKLYWQQRRIRKNPEARQYVDLALTPVEAAEEESLQLYEITDAAKNVVAKAKSLANRQLRNITPEAPVRPAA